MSASAVDETALLHLGVVEVAEHALQLLERDEDVLQIGGLVEPRGDVDEIAKLLGSDSDGVELVGRAAAVDGVGTPGDPAAEPPGPLRHHIGQRTPPFAVPDASDGRLRNACHSDNSRR